MSCVVFHDDFLGRGKYMSCTKQDVEREFILQNQSLSSNPVKLKEMSSLLAKVYKLDHSWASQLWNEVIDQHTQNKPEHAKYYVGRIAKGITGLLRTNAMFDFLFIDESRGKKLLQYGPPRVANKWERLSQELCKPPSWCRIKKHQFGGL